MTNYILPMLLTAIMLFSIRKTDVYSEFIKGVGDGLNTVIGIFPAILAILTSTAMLESSGVLDLLMKVIKPFTDFLGVPEGVMPLALIKPLSGGASLGVLTDILNKYHPDSMSGLVASVIMGSTETTFYTLCVYFRKTRVKYTKRIIPAAIIGDIVGLIAAVLVCKIIF